MAREDANMIESVQQLVDIFPRRFVFNALIPTLVFLTVTGGLVTDCFEPLNLLPHWWLTVDAFTKLAAAFGYLAVVWFLASGVASQWRNIVRLYEGYPQRAFFARFKVTVPGVAWHQSRLDQLRPPPSEVAAIDPARLNQLLPTEVPSDEHVRADPVAAYYRYPLRSQRDRILPTSLGNILLAGESYSTDHYGIDCIIFFPRLWPLLPESFRQEYEEFEAAYEFPIVISFLSLLSTLVTCVAILVSHQSPFFFLGVLLGGSALAALAYQLCLSSAEELAEQQRTAFDLYRDRLLENWPTVEDVRDETRAFEMIRSFVVINKPANWGPYQKSHHDRRLPDSAAEEGK